MSGPPPGVDYSRKWFVMAAVALGIFLGTIDGSIVNVALPTLVDDLGTTFATVQWVVLGYLLTLATLTLMVGRLGDIVGKKPIYTLGFSVFTVSSMLAGLSPNVGWLIGFRVLQAFGAAMIISLGIAILTEAFPPAERGRALGIAGSMVSIGIVLGPTIGGVLIDALSWHWIFFVNLPVGIVGTIAAVRFIPVVKPPGGQRFDFAGAATFFSALVTFMLGLTIGQDSGFSSPAVLTLLTVSVLCWTVFIRIEQRTAEPMVELSLFRNPLLTVNLVTGFMVFVAIAGLLILLPFYLENVLGYQPQAVGLLLAAAPITLGLVAPFSGALSDKIGPRPVTIAGLAILVVGYAGVSRLGEGTQAWQYVLVALPIGLGMGTFQSPNNSAIMGSVPPQRLGITSGMLAITRITGQITGISLLGAVWAGRVAAAAGVSGDATQAPAAAQVSGLRDVFIGVAGMMAVALGIAVWGLRRERKAARAPTPGRA